MKSHTRTSSKSKHKSTAHSQRLVLESRLVFDGAMAATVVEAQADTVDSRPVTENASAAAAPPSEPPVDFTAEKTPPVVDYQPSSDTTDSQPAFPVEPSPLDSKDLPANPMVGVSGEYSTTLIVVDPRARCAAALLANPPANTQIITLDTARDGFQQVADVLQGRHDVTELHVLPWADANGQWLGNKSLSATLQPSVSNALTHWGDSFTDNANIIFHGITNQNASWISHIDALTGADTSWSQETDLTTVNPYATSPAPLFVLTDSSTSTDTLVAAEKMVQDRLTEWFQQDDVLSQLAIPFSVSAESPEWTSNALALRDTILNGDYSIRLEVRSSAELNGVLGAFSSTGTSDQPTLYLNAEWLSTATAKNIESVLLEELGHSFDYRLNGALDSQGDEGEAFAALVLYNDTNLVALRQQDDHGVINIDGKMLAIEAAGVATITSDGSGATATVNVIADQLIATSVTATGTGTLSYSISGGADAAKFVINSSTGLLSFANLSYATLNSVYNVQVTAADSTTTDSQVITINVAVPNPDTLNFGIAAGTQTFFIPGTAEKMWYIEKQLQSDNAPDLNAALYSSKGLHSIVTVAATADNTIIYYDHWEDTYNATPTTLGTVSSTFVTNNGITGTRYYATGSSGAISTTISYALNKGQSLILETKEIPITHVTQSPTTPVTHVTSTGVTEQIYDGGDRIYAVGGPVTTSYALWPEAIGTVFGLAWEIYPAKPFNTEYTIPIGENMGVTSFQDVHTVVQAMQDNTTVSFDVNGDGVADTVIDTDLNGSPDAYQVTLQKGESTQLIHVNVGTKVLSDKPVQVLMVTGSTANYESRAYSLTPSTLWSNDYYNPVDGGATTPTELFLYNPNATPITVYRDEAGGANGTVTGSDGQTYTYDGTYIIPGKTTVKYSTMAGHTVPDNSAVHLFTTTAGGVDKFWGVGAVDTGAGKNWGFSLVPSYILNTDYTFGWAPQWDFNNSPSTTGGTATPKGSGIFITPANDNTTVYIDYDRNGTVDKTLTLNRLQTTVIYDINNPVTGYIGDNDNTGTHIWSTDKIAAAWGENPDTSQLGLPYLDMGYTALPLPPIWLDVAYGVVKSSNIDALTPSGAPQSVTYTLQVPAYQVLLGLAATDKLATGWSYVDGSTVITLPDGSSLTGAASNPVLGMVSGRQTMLWDSPEIPGTLNANSMVTIRYTAKTSVDTAAGPNENNVSTTGTVGGVTMTSTDNKFVDVRATIGDRVFNDLDSDGVFDAGETGIAGVTVTLTRTAGGAVIATATTDSNGRFLFTGLDDSIATSSAGTYTLTAATPVNYAATYAKLTVTTGATTTSSTSASGASSLIGFNPNDDTKVITSFGFHDNSPIILGQVRLDTDNDGVPGDPDSGIAGVTISLYLDNGTIGSLDAADTLISTQLTNVSGTYSFSGLVAGTKYLVVETNPAGATSTYDSQGANNDQIAITAIAGNNAGNDFLDYTPPPTITKTVISTSNALTGTIDGTVNTLIDLIAGETVTYELVVTIPDGRSASSLVITDVLPTNPGASLTLSSVVIKEVGSNITATIPNPANTGSGQTITLDFGNVSSSSDGVTSSADQIVIWVTATAGVNSTAIAAPPSADHYWALDNNSSATLIAGSTTFTDTGTATTKYDASLGGVADATGGTGYNTATGNNSVYMYNSADSDISGGAATTPNTYINLNASSATLGIDKDQTNFTISAWFNTTDGNGWIFGAPTSTSGTSTMPTLETGFYLSGNKVVADIGSSAVAVGSRTTTNSYNDGKWYMASLVKNGGTATLSIYDAAGVLKETALSFAVGTTAPAGGNVTVGGCAGSTLTVTDLDGRIDAVRIFNNTSLTATQLEQVAVNQGAVSLTHHWAFDETTGTTASDTGSGTAVSGTLVNGTAWTSSGKYSGGVLLDGSNDRVGLGTYGNYNLDFDPQLGNDKFTLSLWVNVAASGSADTDTILYLGDDSSGGDANDYLEIRLNKSGGNYYPELEMGNNVLYTGSSGTSLNDTWRMLTLVVDPSVGTNGTYSFYMDNTQLSTGNLPDMGAADGTLTGTPLTLGARYAGSSVYASSLNGSLDGFRIYEGATLTPTQITSLYNNTLGGGGSPVTLINTGSVTGGASDTENVEVIPTSPVNQGGIRGQVQIDGNDNNALDDSTTTRLGGFTVTLKSADGLTTITTTQTDYLGDYEFGGLPAGVAYRVEITPPTGYVGITDFDGGTDSKILTATITSSGNPVTFLENQNFLIGQPKPVIDLDSTTAGNRDGSPANGADTTSTGYTGNFVFGGGSVVIADTDSSITIAAGGATQLSQLTIILTNPLDGEAESLSIGTLPAGIVVSSATATQVVLSGAASLASYETALEAIRYNNTSAKADLDQSAPRSITVQGVDSNGKISNTATALISMVDLAPTAKDDSFTVAEDSGTTALTVMADHGNGIDIAGDGASTIISVTTPKDVVGAGGVVVGTAVINGNNIDFTPNANYNGPATFTYTIADNNGDISTATVTITVTAVDDPVDAINDTVSTIKGVTTTIVLYNANGAGGSVDVLGDLPTNVTMLNGIARTAGQSITTAGGATVTLNADNTVSYFTPLASASGLDTFTYTIVDSDGSTDTATVNVTVTSDLVPLAVVDAATVQAGRAININVLANNGSGADDQGDGPATVTAVGAAAGLAAQHGTVSINADGTVKYTSDGLFAGNDTFNYTITDRNAGTSTAMVTVTITNTPPVAAADVYVFNTIAADNVTVLNTLTIASTSAGLLGNDFDADGTAGLAVKDVSNATTTVLPTATLTTNQGGTVVVAADGTFVYTCATGFTGVDSFTYTLTDPTGATDTATVQLIVTANHKPVATNDSYATNQGIQFTVTAANGVIQKTTADSDVDVGDVLTISAYTENSANGGIVSMNPDGSFTYRPPLGFIGTDTFQYEISDGKGGTAMATVSVVITNALPVAANDTAVVAFGNNSVAIPVLNNDTDVDGTVDPTTVTIVTSPTSGSVTVDPVTGVVTYNANGVPAGTYTFTYKVKDNDGVFSTPATVTVTVTGTPVVSAANDSATTNERTASTGNQAVQITLTGNDSSAPNALDLSATGIVIIAQPPVGEGSVTVDGSGQVTFTPVLGFIGSTTFTYQVKDTAGNLSNTATVTVLVNSVNAVNDFYDGTTNPKVPKNSVNYVLNVLTNDSDPNGDAFEIIAVTQPTTVGGTVDINGAGTALIYTPKAGYTGADTLTYTIRDASGNEKTATVTIEIVATGAIPVIDLDANDSSGATGLDYKNTFIVGSGAVSAADIADPTGTVITDNDSTQMAGAIIHLANISNAGQEFLSVANVAGIASSYDATTGILTLTGTASIQFYQIAIASLTYNNTAIAPNTVAPRDITVEITDTQGNTSVAAHSFITLANRPVNAMPAPFTVTENIATAVSLSVGDLDSNLTSTQLTVTGGILNVTLSGAAGISAGTNGTASLTISGTQADINATLASLSYTAGIGTHNDTLSVTSTDGTTLTDSDTVAISINNAPNQIPIANPDTAPVTENDSFTLDELSGVIISNLLTGRDTDPDGDPLTVIGVRTGVAVSATDVGTDNVGSVLVGTYGILAMNADGSYSYSADRADMLGAGVTATETFSYAISDAQGGIAFTTLTIIVTGTNDAPDPVGILADAIRVDSASVNLDTAMGFTDIDSNNVFSYSATGLPAGLSIDPATGVITGTLAANASQGGISGAYAVVIIATDSMGVTVTQSFNFTAIGVVVIDDNNPSGNSNNSSRSSSDSDSSNSNSNSNSNSGSSSSSSSSGSSSVATGLPATLVNHVHGLINNSLTSGSLMLLSNPVQDSNLWSQSDLEDKKWHIDRQFMDDNSLPPVHLSLYIPIRHHVISLTGSLRDQVVLELERYSFSVPRWAFRHTDPNEQLEFEAAHPDNSALPEWLKFNAKTLKFTGLPPKGSHDERVMVTARDTYGNEVHTTFTVRVNRESARSVPKPAVAPNKVLEKNQFGEKPVIVGKSGLSEQVHAVGKLSKLQESRALLDNLKHI